MIVGKGSMIGEDDVVSTLKTYTVTVRCLSLRGSAYSIKAEDFLLLKNSDTAWVKVLEKALWKERIKGAEHIGDRIAKKKEIQKRSSKIYELSEEKLRPLRESIKNMKPTLEVKLVNSP